MNPLDKEEFTNFLQTMKKDMPLHTDETVKVKNSYSQGLPKNLMEHSAKVDNKFLNDNLHTIEEMEYRKKGITDGFRDYQNERYANKEILNHDLYFTYEGKIYPKVSGAQPLNIMNTGFIGALVLPHVNGADLTAGAATSSTTGWTAYITGAKVSGGTIGQYYNQAAFNLGAVAGNMNVGVYDNFDTGDGATNLYAASGTHTAVTGYNFQSLTEFSLNETIAWPVFQVSSDTTATWYNSTGTRVYESGHTYTTFEDPFTSESYVANSVIFNCKIGHS